MNHTVKVPGATLRYDVQGSGPVLLMIPGGAGDSTMFAAIAPILSDHDTVVTYDPRGISRSRLEGQPSEVPIELLADDAHCLLSALTTEAAHVLGASGGALTGRFLVVRHPGAVHTLVAQEPPLTLPAARSRGAPGGRPVVVRHLSSRRHGRRHGEILHRHRNSRCRARAAGRGDGGRTRGHG